MQLYPALKANMGDWSYYIVKMRMREVAMEVSFGSQVHNDFTLDEAIQRTIQESRVRREIVTYLQRRPDRFFASLVVAAIGGSPTFYPVSIADDPQFQIFKDESGIEQSFGVLKFSGDQIYYALDGQHRLKAIKTLLPSSADAQSADPPGEPGEFANEEISVLMVIPPKGEVAEQWIARYRRLFSSLNRYAKPTDRDTNIIMDEDDLFAILTRRLISEHEFFRCSGRQLESIRVKTKGKPLREGTQYFTSLQQLYDMNQALLLTPERENRGWGDGGGEGLETDVKRFKQFRPSEDYIDELFEELKAYWDGLIETIPTLSDNAGESRNHQADGSDGKTADNAFFWPIGQDVMVSTARALLNLGCSEFETPDKAQIIEALMPLRYVDPGLHAVPWRGLLLTYEADRRGVRKWKMRNEDRKLATETVEELLRWMVGGLELNEEEESKYRTMWESRLGSLPDDDDSDEMWRNIKSLRREIHLQTNTQ